MPRVTYPNQRLIHINREPARVDFLGINNETWKAASRDLRPPALLLYLYLAANADNYMFALSPAAVRQEIGMARSTYHDQFHILVDKGYLVPSHGNTYEFYEKPHASRHIMQNEMSADGLDFEDNPQDNIGFARDGQSVMPMDIEINNSHFIDTSINIDEFEPLEEYEDIDEEKSEWVGFIPPAGEFVF